ncbi:hypothetical protein [Bifidobacterium eulemuris]|uniref:hypothetical protein n=1 Tax=Bifidobacterium eulemuris TaxID=1765219 RepID=UPI001B801C89|nr:hypothetical protein [Bifidobacterium eulemuris]
MNARICHAYPRIRIFGLPLSGLSVFTEIGKAVELQFALFPRLDFAKRGDSGGGKNQKGLS